MDNQLCKVLLKPIKYALQERAGLVLSFINKVEVVSQKPDTTDELYYLKEIILASKSHSKISQG